MKNTDALLYLAKKIDMYKKAGVEDILMHETRADFEIARYLVSIDLSFDYSFGCFYIQGEEDKEWTYDIGQQRFLDYNYQRIDPCRNIEYFVKRHILPEKDKGRELSSAPVE